MIEGKTTNTKRILLYALAGLSFLGLLGFSISFVVFSSTAETPPPSPGSSLPVPPSPGPVELIIRNGNFVPDKRPIIIAQSGKAQVLLHNPEFMSYLIISLQVSLYTAVDRDGKLEKDQEISTTTFRDFSIERRSSARPEALIRSIPDDGVVEGLFKSANPMVIVEATAIVDLINPHRVEWEASAVLKKKE